MNLFYIDESYDQDIFVYSAINIPIENWLDIFKQIKKFRKHLKVKYSIKLYKELHATDFVNGRGNISIKYVPKALRRQIFKDTLKFISNLKNISIFNAVATHNNDKPQIALERLINRINRTMEHKNRYAILIIDRGKEREITKLIRKISVHNPIPSQYGLWHETQQSSKNIPIDKIIEDPFFKDSERSYFIQLADFCAYSLLCRENPKYNRTLHNLHLSFNNLTNVLFKRASKSDTEGIIRVK